MARYSIYIDENLEEQLEVYMKQNKISKRSVAIKNCIKEIILNNNYQNTVYNIEQKLNTILHRQAVNKNILEQLFANFGFSTNCDISKDQLLKEIRENNNYKGRYD